MFIINDYRLTITVILLKYNNIFLASISVNLSLLLQCSNVHSTAISSSNSIFAESEHFVFMCSLKVELELRKPTNDYLGYKRYMSSISSARLCSSVRKKDLGDISAFRHSLFLLRRILI